MAVDFTGMKFHNGYWWKIDGTGPYTLDSDGSQTLIAGGATGASGGGLTYGLAAARPTASVDYDEAIYYSTDSGALEYCNGVSWVAIAARVDQVAGIPATTWALRGTATAGLVKRITDLGNNTNVFAIGDGTYWQPFGGSQVIYRQAAVVTAAASASSTATSATIVIPAGLMALNGSVIVDAKVIGSATPVAVLPQTSWGGQNTFDGTTSLGTKRNGRWQRSIRNNNATNAQVVFETAAADLGGPNSLSGNVQSFTRDTTAAQNLIVSCNMTHATSIATTLGELSVTWSL